MTDLQFAANVSDGFMFNEAGGLLERYRAARAAGFQAVECANPYQYTEDDLTSVLLDTGLRQVPFSPLHITVSSRKTKDSRIL